MTVVDYSLARPAPEQLKAWDVTAAMRYVGQDTSGRKNMTKAEVAALAAAGIRTGTVFEYTATQAARGTAQGGIDANLGLAQATDCGMPSWRPIYFAVDFDIPDYAPKSADPLAKLGPVGAYFAAAGAVLGVDRVGVYGGYYAVKRVLDARLASWGWQTLAWSGGQWDPRAVLRQTGATLDAGQLDADTAIRTHDHAGDFGAWFPHETKPPGGDVSTAGPENWDAKDKAALLDMLLSTDGVIASPLHNEANPYWAWQNHITWGGEQIAAHTAALAKLQTDLAAVAAKVGQPVSMDLDPVTLAAALPADLAAKLADELAKRLSA